MKIFTLAYPILLLTILCLILSVSPNLVHGETQGIKASIEKSHEKSKQQKILRDKLLENLKSKNLTKEDLKQEGGFYFGKDNKIVLQLKKPPHNKNLNTKLTTSLKELSDSNDSTFDVQYVSYSQGELETLTNEWHNLNSDITFSDNTLIRYDYLNNWVEIRTDILEDNDRKTLIERYGNKIKINVDPQYNLNITDAKARKETWNQLGAGIGIQMRLAGSTALTSCSTAGILKKDVRYFILTAGHCVENIDGNAYQWGALVGTQHLDAQSINHDWGLIEIDQGSTTRYASNGLYIYGGDYDGRLQHYDTVDNAETICKSGITTGYTCGVVTSTAANYDEEVNFEVTDLDYGINGWFVASGDSGSAAFRTSNGYLIGITSGLHIALREGNTSYGAIGYFAHYKPMADKYGMTLYTSNSTSFIR